MAGLLSRSLFRLEGIDLGYVSDPSVDHSDEHSLSQIQECSAIQRCVRRRRAAPRLEAFLLIASAGTALMLAAVGLYSVSAYLVRQQTREIGIRIALGADTRRVLTFALGGAIPLVVAIAVASFIPARRATRIDPTRALRSE
jgi:Predicted permease.